jgi:hypothetical protein
MGHLLGDYLLQNDWIALGKANRSWPCLVHCLCYTAAIAILAMSWDGRISGMTISFPLQWWALPLVFVTHFVVDRTRGVAKGLAALGKAKFVEPPLGPWSVILVDNTIHVLVLFVIAVALHRTRAG